MFRASIIFNFAHRAAAAKGPERAKPSHVSYGLFFAMRCISTRDIHLPPHLLLSTGGLDKKGRSYRYTCSFFALFRDMRLFVAMSGTEHHGMIKPCAVGLKISGEYKFLALLAETFALWAQNLQVAQTGQTLLSKCELNCDTFRFQFCNETAKFVDICLQHMPMDLIPEIDDVTILLSNLQRNPSVRQRAVSMSCNNTARSWSRKFCG